MEDALRGLEETFQA